MIQDTDTVMTGREEGAKQKCMEHGRIQKPRRKRENTKIKKGDYKKM